MSTITVHCPRCGAPVELELRIVQANLVSKSWLGAEVQIGSTEHRCPTQPQDAS